MVRGCCENILISIHAPTRGATMPKSPAVNGNIYFNPRSHKGSDQCHSLLLQWSGISIHAPTRGATAILVLSDVSFTISIHAPTRGATQFRQRQPTFSFHFNPRSHKGSDFLCSIVRVNLFNFNPRSHKGSDPAS